MRQPRIQRQPQRGTQLRIRDFLKGLGEKEAELHGDLQVILSALRRMEHDVQQLIEIEEAGPPAGGDLL